MQHPNAMTDRIRGRFDVGRLAVEMDFTLVGLDKTGKHLHQRAFPGAIFAEDGVNGAGRYGHMDIVVGVDVSEIFVNTDQFYIHGRCRVCDMGQPSRPISPRYVMDCQDLLRNALAFHAFKQLRQVPDFLVGGYLTIRQIAGAILEIDRASP